MEPELSLAPHFHTNTHLYKAQKELGLIQGLAVPGRYTYVLINTRSFQLVPFGFYAKKMWHCNSPILVALQVYS
jgi:hypothetical protein